MGFGTQKHKELRTALFALQFNPEKLADHPVILYSDKASVLWINKGTSARSKKAREILLTFQELKYSLNLDFTAFYIKGSDNAIADSLSRSSLINSELKLKQVAFINLCITVICSTDIDFWPNSQNHKCA